MGEQPVRRVDRPASDKQIKYIGDLRKKLHGIFGSQTPEEFMQSSSDRTLNMVSATLLISDMKFMLREGTPPVRDESVREAPKSERSGYEEGPDSEVVDLPPAFIKIWQAPLSDPELTEYWGWDWLCTHPDHITGIGALRVDRQGPAFMAALEHWGKYHLPED